MEKADFQVKVGWKGKPETLQQELFTLSTSKTKHLCFVLDTAIIWVVLELWGTFQNRNECQSLLEPQRQHSS